MHQHVMVSLHAVLLLHTCSPNLGQVGLMYNTLSTEADVCARARADEARTKEETPPSSVSPAASPVSSKAGTPGGGKHNPFEEADAEEVRTSVHVVPTGPKGVSVGAKHGVHLVPITIKASCTMAPLWPAMWFL